MFTSIHQEDMYQAENRLDTYVNSLNSMRDGSSNPLKIERMIKMIKRELEFIRKEFPESEYCSLKNVVFGMDVVEHFNLYDLV